MLVKLIHKIVKLMRRRWGEEGRGKEPVCGVPVSRAWLSELQHPHPQKMLHVATYDSNPMLQEAETGRFLAFIIEQAEKNQYSPGGWATPSQQIDWTAVEEDRWFISGLHIYVHTSTCALHGITVSGESVIGRGDIGDTLVYDGHEESHHCCTWCVETLVQRYALSVDTALSQS